MFLCKSTIISLSSTFAVRILIDNTKGMSTSPSEPTSFSTIIRTTYMISEQHFCRLAFVTFVRISILGNRRMLLIFVYSHNF